MTTAAETSLRLTRTIRTDPQTAFEAWTRPEHIRRWSCPPDHSVVASEVDLTVGGSYLLRMANADGLTHTAFGTYRKIEPPQRLVYTWDWQEDDHRMGETIVTVEFHAVDDGTEVTVTHEGFPAAEVTADHELGWNACIDGLERLFSNAGDAAEPATASA